MGLAGPILSTVGSLAASAATKYLFRKLSNMAFGRKKTKFRRRRRVIRKRFFRKRRGFRRAIKRFRRRRFRKYRKSANSESVFYSYPMTSFQLPTTAKGNPVGYYSTRIEYQKSQLTDTSLQKFITHYVSLYDRFKVTKVGCSIRPMRSQDWFSTTLNKDTVGTGVTYSNFDCPVAYTVYDVDSEGKSLSTENDFLLYAAHKKKYFKPFSSLHFSLRPRFKDFIPTSFASGTAWGTGVTAPTKFNVWNTDDFTATCDNLPNASMNAIQMLIMGTGGQWFHTSWWIKFRFYDKRRSSAYKQLGPSLWETNLSREERLHQMEWETSPPPPFDFQPHMLQDGKICRCRHCANKRASQGIDY